MFERQRRRAVLVIFAALGTIWLAIGCSAASVSSPPLPTSAPDVTRAPLPLPTSTIGVLTATVRATLVPTAGPTPRATAVFHTPTPDTGNVTVQAAEQFFNPAVITVAVGTTVTWKDVQGSHDVVADDGSFASSTLDEGGTFTYKFRTRGRFHYVCTFHAGNGMFADVIVQ
jgi:plastocyanin